jgi:hypothetical protein
MCYFVLLPRLHFVLSASMHPIRHAILLAFLSIGVTLLYLDAPQFSDDFSYWSYGFDIHENGTKDFWSSGSFHQLRWPVWGLCWAGQGIFGPGLVSYYFAPFLFVLLGSVATFSLGWKLFNRIGPAWACGIAFLFHPLLDVNLTRPYPDIFEGIIGAGAVFAWWALMNEERRGRMVLLGTMCGVCLFIAMENRLTGVFFVPLVCCLTVLFFPRRALRLLPVMLVFAVLLGAQMWFYQSLYGDSLHFIHANSNAKGKAGTDAIALWKLPFRFLDGLSDGGVLMPLYACFGAFGIWLGWRRHGLLGRVTVAWFVLLYLAYACAPQQLWPYRPMLRDAARFLSSLAIPYSVLAIFGVMGTIELLRKSARFRGFDPGTRPIVTGIVAFALLAVLAAEPIGNRNWFTLDYVQPFRAYMRSLPPGTAVFSHRQMRVLAHLVDGETASKLDWVTKDRWITAATPELNAAAERATEFWYVRKLALMRMNKSTLTEDEDKKVRKQPQLAPWFEAPERDWQLRLVLARGDTPEIVLHRKRVANTAPFEVFTNESPGFRELLPALPFDWKPKSGQKQIEVEWPVPVNLRGRLVRIEAEGSSDKAEPFTVKLEFRTAGRSEKPLMMKPQFFPDGGKTFDSIPVPANAETCKITVRLEKGTDRIRINTFRVIADSP